MSLRELTSLFPAAEKDAIGSMHRKKTTDSKQTIPAVSVPRKSSVGLREITSLFPDSPSKRNEAKKVTSRSRSRSGAGKKGTRGTRRALSKVQLKAAAHLDILSARFQTCLCASLVLWLLLLSAWVSAPDATWNAHYFIPLITLYGLCMFTAYLAKDSPLVGTCNITGIEPENRTRAWSHPLVWSSLSYGAASAFALHEKMYSVAALLFIVCWGSTMFHKFRETKWFNLDNIYAQSLIGVGVTGDVHLILQWTVYSQTSEDIWKALALAAFSVWTFYCLGACGQPAIVNCCPDGKKQRVENPKYSPLHTGWHFGSAILIAIAIRVISTTNGLLFGRESFDEGYPIPVGSALMLAFGFLLNYTLNYTKAGPWE